MPANITTPKSFYNSAAQGCFNTNSSTKYTICLKLCVHSIHLALNYV